MYELVLDSKLNYLFFILSYYFYLKNKIIKILPSSSYYFLIAAASLKRSIDGVASRLEQLRTARDDVLEAATMEGVMLPKLSGRKAAKAAADADASDSDTENDAAEDMEVDGEVDDNNEGGPSTAPRGRKPSSGKKAPFDFTSLTDDDRRREAKARERHDADQKSNMEQISTQLARMAPNLKAVEQYEEVKAREREQIEEVDSARRECKAAAETFNTIRERRYDLFNAALAHITENIDPIYKDLTKSSIHPSGGQAYLAPENPEDPFAAGIKFSAMPPTKRFREM